jgi:long-chain acyl-CoA synthetase
MRHTTTNNLAEIVPLAAAGAAGRIAVKLDSRLLTYPGLDDASGRMAALLTSMGVDQGDRVGIMLPNVPEFAIAYYGVLRCGAVVVPMNVLLKEREIAFYLRDSGARVLLAWRGMDGAARRGAAEADAHCVVIDPAPQTAMLADHAPAPYVAPRKATDTAVILYTSGTTGRPKGAELTHTNLLRNLEVTVNLFDMAPDDVVFGGLPLFHSFGQTCGMNAAIASGATLSLMRRFEPAAALSQLECDGVTIFEGVPTMYVALLNHPYRDRYEVGRLRLCVSGGAALPVEVLHGFEAEFGCEVLEGYGLSETSPVASFNHPGRKRKPGSIGTPVEGVEMKLVDDAGGEVREGEVGEIAIRGHNVMKGYRNAPQATAEAIDIDGWLKTGDMARVDEDGYFFIVDRKKDLIIRGGYNVYPREIEEVIYEHPAVREAAVIGVPHNEYGEEVTAAVALREGAQATPDELREFVKGRVAAYKYPRHVWLVEELPKGPTGKILKREIVAPANLIETPAARVA